MLPLTTSCGADREATGECRGTYRGEQVAWPIDGVSSRLGRDRFGFVPTWLWLNYLPGGQATLTAFGADVELTRGMSLERSSGPLTVQLLGVEVGLAPEEGTPVVRWMASYAVPHGAIAGFPHDSGIPASGTLTLDEVSDDSAEGRFVYRYASGDELTCTFNVPTPAAAGDAWRDTGDGDDD
ncbi:putative lipoprotein [Myxococcus stipitatus DSM 14675]|uniref:Putative lipoprotein n=2 Tax=Myxococcus stipitatus TaxID=83455 RepID=L7U7D9_MYXSD|nr:putative lipoprotein [Myxococcus stipitatus DSM 14675]